MRRQFSLLEQIKGEWDLVLVSGSTRITEMAGHSVVVDALAQYARLSEEMSLLELLIGETEEPEARMGGESDLSLLAQELKSLEEKLGDFEQDPNLAQRRSVIVEFRPQTESVAVRRLTEQLIEQLMEYAESVRWKCREGIIHETVPATELRADLAPVAASLPCLRIDGVEAWYRMRLEAANYVRADRSPVLTVQVCHLNTQDEMGSSDAFADRIIPHPILGDRAAVCLVHQPTGIGLSVLLTDEKSVHRTRSTTLAYLMSRLMQLCDADNLPIRVLEGAGTSLRDERLAGEAFSLFGRDSVAHRIDALLEWKRRHGRFVSRRDMGDDQ